MTTTGRERMKPVPGLKKPSVPPPPRPEAETVAPPAQDHQPATAAPVRAAGKTGEGKRRSRPRSADTITMKLVSVSVPVSLAERWSARAKLDRSSQADVLRDAIEAHHGELSELLTATSPRTIVTSGLFDRPAASTRERAVGVSLRLPSQNLDVIDALSAQHGAENRSQLLTAALTAYLRDTAPVRR